MKTAENVKKVALIFFIFLGVGNILSALIANSGYFLPNSAFLNRIFNIPFALSGVIYGFASLSNASSLKNTRLLDIAFISITVFIFLALIYISFLIPDQTTGLDPSL